MSKQTLVKSLDEILSFVDKKGDVEVGEIRDVFGLSEEGSRFIADFFVRFGLAEVDATESHIHLSEPFKEFLKEIDT